MNEIPSGILFQSISFNKPGSQISTNLSHFHRITHHFNLILKDARSGKRITDASVMAEILRPAKKSTSIDLMTMMDHFGGSLNLFDLVDMDFFAP